jgi:acyl transferase domain-containing protein
VFGHRRILVCDSAATGVELAAALAPANETAFDAAAPRQRAVAFLLPGQGAQHAGMARGVYDAEPMFRAELDRAADLLTPHLGLDLRRLLFPAAGAQAEADEQLRRTRLAQPALFAVEYALAKLWQSWGVEPRALLGHSVGEYVAACLAGVMPLGRALELVARRGRLMQSLPPGAMLAVPLSEAEVVPLLGPQLAVAAVNAPDRVVVAGAPAAAARLAEQLAVRGIGTRALAVGHAFHSPEVAALLPAWEAELGRTPLAPPEIPYLSTLTGTWATAGQATSAAAWAEHLRAPARLAPALAELLSDPSRVLLEVGPGQSLTVLARRQRPGAAGGGGGAGGSGTARTILASLPGRSGPSGDLAFLLGALGQLWLAGVEIDWSAIQPDRGRRVPLPTYPFERQRYWIAPAPSSGATAAASGSAAPVRRAAAAVVLGTPVWRPALPVRATGDREPETWLLLLDGAGLGARLAQRLVLPRPGEPPPRAVVMGVPGRRFARLSEGTYSLDPLAAADHDALIAAADATGGPLAVVHLLGVDAATPGDGARTVADEEVRALRSLAHLAAALARRTGGGGARIDVVTLGAVDLGTCSAAAPARAALRGVCEGVAAAHPDVACRLIDVMAPPAAAATPREEQRWLDRLLSEIATPPVPAGPAPVAPRAAQDRSVAERAAGPAAAGRSERTAAASAVALRGRQRWVEGWEPLPPGFWSSSAAARPESAAPVEPTGYLVAAGDEDLAADLAAALARQRGARVVVIGTPPRGERPPGADSRSGATGRWPDDAWLEEREAALLALERESRGFVQEPEAPGSVIEPEAPGSVVEPEAPGLVVEREAPGSGVEPEAPGPVVEREAPGPVTDVAAEAAVTAALDALCTSAIVRYLGAGGIPVERGAAVTWRELRQRLRLVPRGERLLRRLLSFLAEDGVIEAIEAAGTGEDGAGESARFTRGADEAVTRGTDEAVTRGTDEAVRFTRGAAELGTVAERRRALELELPHLAGVCELIDHCTGQYPRALAGEIEGLEVLYPGGSPELLERAVHAGEAAAAADLAPALLRELLAAAAAGPGTGGRPLRILEVGAGQGVLTRELLPVLAGRPVDYHFTDIGRAFVLRAEERAAAAGHSFLRFGVLDIARDPLAQGFPTAGYDAVLGANVVHATPRIAGTLGHLASLLAPGGLLALVETVRQRRWGDMVWGLTDGWWSFADAELRQLSPLLGAAQWVEQLGLAGLAGASAWPRATAARARSDSALLLARRPQAPGTAALPAAAGGIAHLALLPSDPAALTAPAALATASALATPPAAATSATLPALGTPAAPATPAVALAAEVAAAGAALPPLGAVIWAGRAAAGWQDGLPSGLAGAAALAEQLAHLPQPPALYVLCSSGPGARPYLDALAERLAEREEVAGACVSLHAEEGGEAELPAALLRLLAARRAGEPLPTCLALRRPAVAPVAAAHALQDQVADNAIVPGPAEDAVGTGRAEDAKSAGSTRDAMSAGRAESTMSAGRAQDPGSAGRARAVGAGRAGDGVHRDDPGHGGAGSYGGGAEHAGDEAPAADATDVAGTERSNRGAPGVRGVPSAPVVPSGPGTEGLAAPGAGSGPGAGAATLGSGITGTMLMHARPQLLVPYAAPRGPAEERIAAIWSRALGMAPIGIHDNFMELGGDSLTGLRVMREIGEAFDLDGHGLSLYETPTVATIAAALTGGGGEALIARRESRGQRRRELRQGARRNP